MSYATRATGKFKQLCATGPARIIVNGCIHGHENLRLSLHLYLHRNYASAGNVDETLDILRNSVEFIFVPGINPYGVNNSVRKTQMG